MNKEDEPEVATPTQVCPIDVSIFGETTGLADVKLLVEETSIPVIKAVLSVSSPIFRVMFQGDFKEKDQREISLPGKKLEDIVMLLSCVYPDNSLTVTEHVAFSILPLADEYQMLTLKATCENILLQTLQQNFESYYQKDCNYLYKFLAYSIKYNMKCLQPYCLSLASDFKQEERKLAAKIFDIPLQTIMDIQNLALARFEIYRSDVEYLMQEISPNCTKLELIESLGKKSFESSWYGNADSRWDDEYKDTNIKVIGTHLIGLRLAYAFENNNVDIVKMAVTRVRADQKLPGWCHNCEYDLLPENIKRDINGVMVLKF